MAKGRKAKGSDNKDIDPIRKEFSNGVEAYRHEKDKRKNAVTIGFIHDS
jgi:hypothetical protein